MVPLKFSDWDIEPWMIFMDGIIMALEATSVLEHTVTLSTWNHGCSGEMPELATAFLETLG